jgi:hypothetical protein
MDVAEAAGASGLYQMRSYTIDGATMPSSSTTAAPSAANKHAALAQSNGLLRPALVARGASRSGDGSGLGSPAHIVHVMMPGPHSKDVQRMMHEGLIRLQGGSLTWGQVGARVWSLGCRYFI